MIYRSLIRDVNGTRFTLEFDLNELAILYVMLGMVDSFDLGEYIKEWIELTDYDQATIDGAAEDLVNDTQKLQQDFITWFKNFLPETSILNDVAVWAYDEYPIDQKVKTDDKKLDVKNNATGI